MDIGRHLAALFNKIPAWLDPGPMAANPVGRHVARQSFGLFWLTI